MDTTETKKMKDSIAIANYFIDRSNKENKGIDLLKLVKLVYIAHGYILALLKESYLNPRYDKVEAWKFGPVIPTVYHTFKHNGREPISEKGIVYIGDFDEGTFVEPEMNDEKPEPILDFVWKRYGSSDGSSLVNFLHKEGSPWDYYYRPGKNVEIPDKVTELYFKLLFEKLVEDGSKRRSDKCN